MEAWFLAHSDEQAWVGLPLLAAGAPLGALRFSFTRPQKITEEDGSSWRRWPGSAPWRVERATLFEREHRTAETLQRSLLPDRLPAVPGLVLAAALPAGAPATWRSAATGTTPSGCRTASWPRPPAT